MKTPNIAELRMPGGESLIPRWFELENYDLDDWADDGKAETSTPNDDADPDANLALLNFD